MIYYNMYGPNIVYRFSLIIFQVDLESTVPKLPGDSGGHHPDQKIMDLALQLKDARAHAASQKKQETHSCVGKMSFLGGFKGCFSTYDQWNC